MGSNITTFVLLCTPYDMSHDVGGIPIWAKAVFEQYDIDKRNVQLEVFPMDRSSSAYQNSGFVNRIMSGVKDYWSIYKDFRKILHRESYDIVHICTSASISLAKDALMLRYGKRKKVKSVIHFHFGRISELAKKRNWEWKMLKRVVTLADKVVTMDMKSYDTLRAEGFTNVENIPNPLSKAVIEQVDEMRNKVAKVPNTVLFVGHVIQTKGVYELVEAVNAVSGLSLRIVGKCDDTTKCELKQLATRDGGSWLEFVDVIPHEEVIKEMLACDIFALPSYTEGFPNVILESMACGCAIIATPVGAIPEMLQFGKPDMCGLMVDVKDAEYIKQQLLVFQSDRWLKEKCRINAVERVNDLYAVPAVWNKIVELWTSIYNEKC